MIMLKTKKTRYKKSEPEDESDKVTKVGPKTKTKAQ